jgi:hypothetical protein
VNQGLCLNTESTSFKAVVRSFVGESGEGTNRAGGKRQQSFHFLTKNRSLVVTLKKIFII